MMKIFGTGLNGLVGTRTVELLRDKYEFANISRSTGVEITNKEQVEAAIAKSDASIVLHMAAKTDVDGCEKDKENDIELAQNYENQQWEDKLEKEHTAWGINVLGTRNVVNACKRYGKKLIYISTDFVFDGEKGDYKETDTPDPINWYGLTKFKGEDIVEKSNIPFIIVRLSYPYGLPYAKKNDFVRAILGLLREGNTLAGITDHLFVPTFIDDVAGALDKLITENAEGIYHAVGSQTLSPYEASVSIADTFGLDKSLVLRSNRDEYFRGRAPRPYNLSLKNDKIERLGVKMRGFEEGLTALKSE